MAHFGWDHCAAVDKRLACACQLTLFCLACVLHTRCVPQQLTGREVCCYSISCKQQNNIDITLEWLTKHAKS
jgi:hypothetical protein